MSSIAKKWNDTKQNLWKSANKYFGGGGDSSATMTGGLNAANEMFGKGSKKETPQFKLWSKVYNNNKVSDFNAYINQQVAKGATSKTQILKDLRAVKKSMSPTSSLSSPRSKSPRSPRSSGSPKSPGKFVPPSPSRSRMSRLSASLSPILTTGLKKKAKASTQAAKPRKTIYGDRYQQEKAAWLETQRNVAKPDVQGFQYAYRKKYSPAFNPPIGPTNAAGDPIGLTDIRRRNMERYGTKGDIYRRSSPELTNLSQQELYNRFRRENKSPARVPAPRKARAPRSPKVVHRSPRQQFELLDKKKHAQDYLRVDRRRPEQSKAKITARYKKSPQYKQQLQGVGKHGVQADYQAFKQAWLRTASDPTDLMQCRIDWRNSRRE